MVDQLHGVYECRRPTGIVHGTSNCYYDNVLEDIHVYTSNGFSHGHSGFLHNLAKRQTAKIECTFSANDPDCRITVQIKNFTTGATLVQKRIDVYTGISSITLEVTYLGGMVQGPPTYLEELSKLDQYAKAQYIPNRR